LYITQHSGAIFNFKENDTSYQITFNSNPMVERAVSNGDATIIKRTTIEDKVKDMLEKGLFRFQYALFIVIKAKMK